MLDHVFSEKDFEVIFESDLSFEEHIFNQVKKTNSMVGLIKRSFLHLTPDLFRQLYITFVRPHLEYAQVVWFPKLRKRSKLLEDVQRTLHGSSKLASIGHTQINSSRMESRRMNTDVLLTIWWKCTNIFTSTLQQQYRVSSLLGPVQVETTNLN